MVVEMESKLTQSEYAKVTLKLTYKNIAVQLFTAVGVICMILLLLQWFGLRKIFDTEAPMFPFLIATINILLPFSVLGYAQKHFASNLTLQRSFKFVFDDEKISYFAEGDQGQLNWEYVIKYSCINNFLLIYISNVSAYLIKTDELSDEQLNFIKSKIKQPEYHAKTNHQYN